VTHASPTDAKRSHRSARLAWVTFWVTQKSHRAKTLITKGFKVEVRVLPGTRLIFFMFFKGFQVRDRTRTSARIIDDSSTSSQDVRRAAIAIGVPVTSAPEGA